MISKEKFIKEIEDRWEDHYLEKNPGFPLPNEIPLKSPTILALIDVIYNELKRIERV